MDRSIGVRHANHDARCDRCACAYHELAHVAVKEVDDGRADEETEGLRIHHLILLRHEHKVQARQAALVQIRREHAERGAQVLKALIALQVEVLELLEIAAQFLVALRLDHDIKFGGVRLNKALMGRSEGLIIVRLMATRNEGLVLGLGFHKIRLLDVAEQAHGISP